MDPGWLESILCTSNALCKVLISFFCVFPFFQFSLALPLQFLPSFSGTSFLRKLTEPFSVCDNLTRPLVSSFAEPIMTSFRSSGRSQGQKRTIQATSVFVFNTFSHFIQKPSSETKQIEPSTSKNLSLCTGIPGQGLLLIQAHSVRPQCHDGAW